MKLWGGRFAGGPSEIFERFSGSLNALNVANRRIELDNSVTFGGFHWNNPREIFVELRYRFHY